jgi:ribosomal protein S12 methylthiotransferase
MPAPRVSFVSLGCPKALVDSERIITRLRAEGYEIARKHDGADRRDGQHLRLPRFGARRIAGGDRLGAGRERQGHRHRLPRRRARARSASAIPGVLAITGPQAYESVMEAVHEAVPPAHEPFST